MQYSLRVDVYVSLEPDSNLLLPLKNWRHRTGWVCPTKLLARSQSRSSGPIMSPVIVARSPALVAILFGLPFLSSHSSMVHARSLAFGWIAATS
jgi:hypothetical protein